MNKILLKNGNIIDFDIMDTKNADILLEDGIIKKINPKSIPLDALIIDLNGKIVSPGFIESHIHIESSMMPPLEFSHRVIQEGTTTILADPHEIANVFGRRGIELWIGQAKICPLDLYIGVPSCVPATQMEHSGAEINLKDIQDLILNPQIYGLGEMMNFPGIIYNIGDARQKVNFVFKTGKLVDGHCPGLTGNDLKTYISNGYEDSIVRIMSDHESSSIEEVIEKLDLGMYISLRYGSATKDLNIILPSLIKRKLSLDKCMLCSDDLSPGELLSDGHINRIILRAKEIILKNSKFSEELATIHAIKLATKNPGNYIFPFLKLTKRPKIGEIKEKFQANLTIFDSLNNFKIEYVIHNGDLVYSKGDKRIVEEKYDYKPFMKSMNITHSFQSKDFSIPYSGNFDVVNLNVIQTTNISLITNKVIEKLKIIEDEFGKHIRNDLKNDIIKIAVIERHKDTGYKTVGFIKGLGLKSGAIASTVAHDSHNLIVAGTDDDSMAKLTNLMIEHGGGMGIYNKGEFIFFPLPIAGLISNEPISEIEFKYNNIKNYAMKLGANYENIFMTLSFMALPVIPHLKITDMGLIDVDQFKLIDLQQI